MPIDRKFYSNTLKFHLYSWYFDILDLDTQMEILLHLHMTQTLYAQESPNIVQELTCSSV